MKGQEFGIAGKKAVINTVVGKTKESPMPVKKAPSVKKETPVKKAGKEPIKRPAEQPVRPPEQPQEVQKPPPEPEPVVEIVRPLSPPKEPVKRLITVKYSHYKDKF